MSAANKSVELQLQLRQNSEELQSFMRELDTWEADMRRRDEQLRAGGLQEEQVHTEQSGGTVHTRHTHQ